jgi:UDP-glucose 4-epimerase
MRKALITGGGGFIGSHLADRLLSDGWDVTVIDRTDLKKCGTLDHIGSKNFHFITCDVNDTERLTKVSKGIDHVFHLAANSDIRNGGRDPSVDLGSTFMTTRSVLDAMVANGISKLFFSSTSAVYGDKQNTALNEETGDLRPISYYGAYKLASEAVINAYSYMNGIDALIFRFPNVVGPRLTHGVIFDFINKLRADPTRLEILGDGKQKKQYIHVTDLVDGISMLSRDMPNGVSLFNVSAESFTTVNEIADIVCERMGLRNVRFDYTGGPTGWKGDVSSFEYDISKIKRTGWKYRYNSTDAVRETVRGLDL